MSENNSIELSLNDLVAMKNLIEIVTQRGAFKANELSTVGVLFDKLNSFLEETQKLQPQDSGDHNG